MSPNPPTAKRRVVYRGRKIDLALQTIVLADGTPADREVVVHRGAVALVPMVDANHVCLVKNERYRDRRDPARGSRRHDRPGETPDQTARRELAEETGYQAGRMTRVRDWFVSPGVMTERMFLFLCEDLVTGPTDHKPDERLEIVILPWDEALAMAQDGRIRDAKSMLSLLLCDRLRDRGQDR